MSLRNSPCAYNFTAMQVCFNPVKEGEFYCEKHVLYASSVNRDKGISNININKTKH